MNIWQRTWQGTWQGIRRWLSHRLASWQKPDKVTSVPTAPIPAPLRLEAPLQPCVSVMKIGTLPSGLTTGSSAPTRNDSGGELPQTRKLPSKSPAERGRKPLA